MALSRYIRECYAISTPEPAGMSLSRMASRISTPRICARCLVVLAPLCGLLTPLAESGQGLRSVSVTLHMACLPSFPRGSSSGADSLFEPYAKRQQFGPRQSFGGQNVCRVVVWLSFASLTNDDGLRSRDTRHNTLNVRYPRVSTTHRTAGRSLIVKREICESRYDVGRRGWPGGFRRLL
jgi:hypothetical protein